MDKQTVTHTYEVYVGNIGRVYNGSDSREAMDNYTHYAKLSDSRQSGGRAWGETVCLLHNGEITREHTGSLAMEQFNDNPTA